MRRNSVTDMIDGKASYQPVPATQENKLSKMSQLLVYTAINWHIHVSNTGTLFPNNYWHSSL